MKEIMVSVLNSAVQVIQKTTGLSLARAGEAAAAQSCDVNVIINVEGKVKGWVAIAMPRETAQLVSAKMLGQAEPGELDDLHRSCLAELGNMIAGNAATDLSHQGLACTVSPPSVGGEPENSAASQVAAVALAVDNNYPVTILVNISAS